jgi:hypothetical protein
MVIHAQTTRANPDARGERAMRMPTAVRVFLGALVALGPLAGAADASYQSDLVCAPPFQGADGEAVVKSNTDLYVKLSGVAPESRFRCRLLCVDGSGWQISAVDQDCGAASRAGVLTTISSRLAGSERLGVAPGALCRGTVVELLGSAGERCSSGFRVR